MSWNSRIANPRGRILVNTKKRKYTYKVNSSLSLGYIRERLVQIFSQKRNQTQLINQLSKNHTFLEGGFGIAPIGGRTRQFKSQTSVVDPQLSSLPFLDA
ncbi:MAG: hypothetical protein JKY53_11795 [Flavobacteriales bacterium]|nr:hypothetical protein [Flavobacteriales bacterium]